MEGGFCLYNTDIKAKGQVRVNEPAVLLPRHQIYGDYELIFDLYPRMEFSPYLPGRSTTHQIL